MAADEIVQPGDEVDVGGDSPMWVTAKCIGRVAGVVTDRYRRRVTPEAEAPQTRASVPASKEFAGAVNRLSMENGSNTPDWIIGDFIAAVLTAFDSAVNAREKWYGRTAPLPEALRQEKEPDVPQPMESNSMLTEEILRLRSEAARRRLRPEEVAAIRDACPNTMEQQKILIEMFTRLGGGE